MQSNLFGFEDTHSHDDNPIETTEEYTVFSGEIAGGLFEEISRHITGYFDHLLLEVSGDGMTLHPFISDEETENALLQHIHIESTEWESFDLSEVSEYTCIVSPRSMFYDTVKGSDVPDTIPVSIDCVPDHVSQWDELQEHPLHDATQEQQDVDSGAVDTLYIDGDSHSVLRNPGYEPLNVEYLQLESEVTVDSMFDVKQWFSQRGTGQDSSIVLIALSSGPRNAENEYVLSLTDVAVDDWEVQDSLVLTGSSMISTGDSDEISDVRIGGVTTWPDDTIKQCLPEVHDDAMEISYAFYHTDRVRGMLKHLLKSSLTTGEFTLELSTQFPMRLSHDIETSSSEIETGVNVVNTLAPVISPQEL